MKSLKTTKDYFGWWVPLSWLLLNSIRVHRKWKTRSGTCTFLWFGRATWWDVSSAGRSSYSQQQFVATFYCTHCIDVIFLADDFICMYLLPVSQAPSTGSHWWRDKVSNGRNCPSNDGRSCGCVGRSPTPTTCCVINPAMQFSLEWIFWQGWNL